MKYSLFTFLLIINCNQLFAQNTFSFKGQVYHNKLGPQKNISILIDNQYPAVTNDAGIFKVGLPKGTNHIKVSLAKTSYTLLYPYGGFVSIPRDLNDVPQIIIGNIKENDYLSQYLTLYKIIRKKPSSTDANTTLLKKRFDSLETLLIKLHYTENEIRTAKEIQDGKDDYLPEVSADLSDYARNAINLKTAFKYIADYAFDNASALQKLAEAITNYNNSFNKLDRQHINYERRIADYWQSDSINASFKTLMDFALDTLHRENIFPMQKLIADVRSYFESRKKSSETKKNIQLSINTKVQQLEPLLSNLEDSTNVLLRMLAG